MKIVLSSIILTTLAIVFISCESKPQKAQEIQNTSKKLTKTGLITNSYTLTTTANEKITFQVSNNVMLSNELNGKMVLINFWATWCKPCIKELPIFVELQKKYKDNFSIIAVLFEKDKDVKALINFMKKHDINFPVTVGEENFVLAKAFGDIQMVPESFLYTKDGFFVEKFIGEIDKSKLEKHIKEDME